MQKLYLKIVVAIWIVMAVSVFVGIAIVRYVSTQPESQAMIQPRIEAMLPAMIEAASLQIAGSGPAGLVDLLQNDPMLSRLPIHSLKNADGAELLERDRSRFFPGRNVEVSLDTVRRFEIDHDGQTYTLSVFMPNMRNPGLGGPTSVQRAMAIIAFRPSYTWMMLIVAVPLSVFLSIIIARYLVRPLTRFQLASQSLADGDLTARIGPVVSERGDELAEFAATFDQMAGRIETLVRSHKELLRDVSHELRSPLARVLAALSLARQRTGGSVDIELDRIEIEIDKLNGMIESLLAFARLDASDMQYRSEPLDVSDLVEDVVAESMIEARAQGKDIELHSHDPAYVLGDRRILESSFENIVRNAVRHTPDRSKVDISIDRPGNSCCEIVIRDYGKGVPEEDLNTIFEPFAKSGGANPSGSGIGLAIARKAVLLHDGSIEARNAADGGLEVIVRLPLQRQAPNNPLLSARAS